MAGDKKAANNAKKDAKAGAATTNHESLPTHYIGIGASAGGLEALQKLLQNLPVDTGACFIIVQHLSPDFKSMMLELLSKHTSMEILNVQDGMQVQPNTIYLIPPKKNMMVAQGELLLSDKVPDSGLNLPIDIFFRSLSEDQQHKAIGIILSGTGSDGSRGLKALKEAGALVIAQEPESAKFDGMPNSAINTGIVDLILRPEDMGQKIQTYITHPLVTGDSDVLRDSMSGEEDTMKEIFNVLRMKSEIDFAKYKPSTVARRIERRMTIKQVTSLREYLTLLFKESHEVEVLSKELLIGVTRFFRDDDAFTLLKEKIIPDIVKQSKDDAPIRIWSAACSSGEEAYSLAMLFSAELDNQQVKRQVKVFATDVNGDAISEASNGIYTEDIVHDVDPTFLSNYFTRNINTTYQVNKKVRQMVIFATHNMISDPPFSNMDLVTCRNVLIYFQHSIQKRALSSLHFALRKSGYLFLGSSENLGDLTPHFEVINERNRIYRKRSNVRIPIGSSPPTANVHPVSNQAIPSVSRLMKNYRGANAAGSAISFANEKLITQYAPPCILLSEEHEALHVYGDVSDFVRRLPPGRISVDIKDLVNDDISIAVSSALQRAKQSEKEVYYSDVFTNAGAEPVPLNLRVKYMKEHEIDASPGYFWLIFEKTEQKLSSSTSIQTVSFDAAEQSRQRIEDLELELKRSKENLQVTVEELETTNEELQSANEELMSANEELQSTNEELQSVNEELYTVNSEYQEKIAEISQANGDLDEVLGLSKIGIIFLDENMLIRRYTHAVAAYINLMDTDVNRPLHHISKNIEYDSMLADVSEVFSTSVSQEHEIVLEDKRVLRISINPYSYNDVSQSRGVAITFSDVSKVKYTEMGMAVAYKQLRSSINNALEVLDNKAFVKDLNVLILDDSDSDTALIEQHLSAIKDCKTKAYKSKTVATALSKIEKYSIDVCLVDYHLTDETGLDFVNCLRNLKKDIPTIVLTGDITEDISPILLSHGVLDLIEKDELASGLLLRSIRYAIRRKEIDDEIASLIPAEAKNMIVSEVS